LRDRAQDRSNSLAKIRNGELGQRSQFFPITAIDENCAATGGMRAIDIAPPVADEETSRQVDLVRCRAAQEHARFWFPAIARVAVSAPGVKTNFDPVKAGEIGL
jgi:hypothetical protein